MLGGIIRERLLLLQGFFCNIYILTLLIQDEEYSELSGAGLDLTRIKLETQGALEPNLPFPTLLGAEKDEEYSELEVKKLFPTSDSYL